MVTTTDATASGSTFISVPDGNGYAAINAAPADGFATYTFDVKAGTYQIWGKVKKSGNGDSFWIEVDGGTPVKWNNIAGAANTWTWDSVHDTDSSSQQMTYTLSAGTHTLKVYYRESATELDQLYITSDGDTPNARFATSEAPVSMVEQSFVMYPNPALDHKVNLKASLETNAQVIVINALGQVVENLSFQNTTNLSFEISRAGLYMVKVVENGQVTDVKRLIVK